MKNCALVVSSGGARGFAAIGIIEELEKRGYTIKSVAGCSMGSLITGMYAAGKLEDFKKWSLSLTKKDILMLMDIALEKTNYSKVNELSERFIKVCKNLCKENEKIQESLKNLEPEKNES